MSADDISNPVALTGANQAAAAAPTVYRGLVAHETGGASSVTVVVYDNTAASGTILDAITLTAGAAAATSVPPGGLWVSKGVYVKVTGSGTVEGSVRLG